MKTWTVILKVSPGFMSPTQSTVLTGFSKIWQVKLPSADHPSGIKPVGSVSRTCDVVHGPARAVGPAPWFFTVMT